MKKKFGLLLMSIATFVFAIHTASAYTSYNPTDWIDAGGAYGEVNVIDTNLVNLKGTDTTLAATGMWYGPYSNISTGKLADGIYEEINVELDPEKYTHGEFFDVSLGLKDGSNNYVSEARIFTQKVGDKFKLTVSWDNDFETYVSQKGIYTYGWSVYTKDDGITYVDFYLYKGGREVASLTEKSLDAITQAATSPIADQDDVAVKYIWFDSINAVEGVNVYTELPTVKLTFVDPVEDDDFVEYVYKYTSYLTEAEKEEFMNQFAALLEEEGYIFEGFFADEDFTTEFDLTSVLEDDTTVYTKLSLIETGEEVFPPKTSDINLSLVITMMLVAFVGVVFVARKRLARNN